MKNLISFFGQIQPEGNTLQWSATGKSDTHFRLLYSSNGLNFDPLETFYLGSGRDTDSIEQFSYTHTNYTEGINYYQLHYYPSSEEAPYESKVVQLTNSKPKTSIVAWVARAIAAALIMIVAFVGMNFLTAQKKDPPKKKVEEVVKYVKATPATFQDFNTTITALGKVISTQPLDIAAEVQGKILKGDINLQKAQSFSKGSVLFIIEKEEALLSLKSQRATFLNQLATVLPDLKIDFPEVFDIWNNYFQRINIERILPTLPNISNQREKVFFASRNILTTYYNIKSIEERLDKYTVTAPYTGIITDVFADVGSIASPGLRVMRIMQTSGLELELPVRKEDLQWLSQGSSVTILNEDETQTTTGKVVRIGKMLDPTTQSVNVYISIKRKKGMFLYEGMYLKAELNGSTVKNAMKINRRAISNGNEIFTVVDGKLKKKNITVKKLQTETALISGLSEGEQVVTEALVGGQDGIEVQIIADN